jgi:hypothetical protein
MTEALARPADPRISGHRPSEHRLPRELHGFWWLHDARWYQGVRKRYGAEVANEINAEAIIFVARRVARWYTNALGLDVHDMPLAELVARFEEVLRVMWPEEMTRLEQRVIGPDEFETVMCACCGRPGRSTSTSAPAWTCGAASSRAWA